MLRGECCCCDCGEKKPQQQPQRPMVNGRPAPPVQRGGEDTPFVPPVPSWDTPQRPGFGGYAPSNDASGTFLGLGDTLQVTTSLLFENGQSGTTIQPRFDHQAGKVYGKEVDYQIQQGYSKDGVPLAMFILEQYLDTPAQAKPHAFSSGYYGSIDYTVRAINLTEKKNRGELTNTYYSTTLDYKDGRASREQYGTAKVSGSIMTADFDLVTTLDGKSIILRRIGPLEIVTQWIGLPKDPRIVRKQWLTMQVENPAKPDWRYWFTGIRFIIAELPTYNKTPKEWGAEYPGDAIATYTTITGSAEHQLWHEVIVDPPRPGIRTFTSPDGAVFVQGKDTDSDPANLKDAELTAYGHSFKGGTWTALRDNPQLRKDGSWDYSPLIVLHEKGDVVTAVRPDGSKETTTRAKFAKEVLRIEPDKFERFSSQGAGLHSWPPQWVYAGSTAPSPDGAAVAIVAHDAWRDNIKHPPTPPPNPPLPAGWVWTGRPPKRPKVVPTSAPRPPLGLALAGAQPFGGIEALKKGQGPLDPPIKAEVKEKEVWKASDSALRALAKRMLYQPAGWPEELSDGTNVGRLVRVTFDTTDERLLLWLRLKVNAGQEPTFSIEGRPVQLLRLGHNAPEKNGFHPYFVEIETPRGNDGKLKKTLTLEYNGKLSRLLKLDAKKPQET